MGVYDDEIATAFELINENGGAITFRTIGTGAPTDATKPWLGNETAPVTHSHVAVVIDYPSNERQSHIGSKLMLIPAQGITFIPHRGMQIEDAEGTIWEIADVDELAPNFLEKIMYQCEVREWSSN